MQDGTPQAECPETTEQESTPPSESRKSVMSPSGCGCGCLLAVSYLVIGICLTGYIQGSGLRSTQFAMNTFAICTLGVCISVSLAGRQRTPSGWMFLLTNAVHWLASIVGALLALFWAVIPQWPSLLEPSKPEHVREVALVGLIPAMVLLLVGILRLFPLRHKLQLPPVLTRPIGGGRKRR